MPKHVKPAPKYRFHKARNCAVVTIDGRNRYLGPYGSPASYEKYARLLAEWRSAAADPTGNQPPPAPGSLRVVELIDAYWHRHVEQHYVKDGRPTGEQNCIREALKPLKALYASVAAVEFGPVALKALRQTLIDAGLARTTINGRIERIKRMYRWAASEELVPIAAFQSLATVAGLRAGRSKAREPAPVMPVADAVVDATLPHLPAVVADMVRLQRLTGMRPGEVCQLRPADVDRTGDAWCYVPASHKTQHHGRERRIYIGPRAQAVLLPYLLRDAQAPCFSPIDAEAKRHDRQRAARKTRVQPSQRNRRQARPKRTIRDRYTKDTYNVAIRRACAKAAGLKRPIRPKDASNAAAMNAYHSALAEYNAKLAAVSWSANQLRHAAATEIRKRFGIEGAQVALGHSRADVTQVYAERDFGKAAAIMAEVG
jgi:integrase